MQACCVHMNSYLQLLGSRPVESMRKTRLTNFLLKSKLAKEADASVAAHILASDENDAAEPMHLALLNYLHAYRHICPSGSLRGGGAVEKKEPQGGWLPW